MGPAGEAQGGDKCVSDGVVDGSTEEADGEKGGGGKAGCFWT